MLANLRALFGVVVDILLLRRGPEHLPASATLLVTTIVLFAVISGAVAASVATPDQNWPLELVVVVLITPLWYHLALRLANKRERFLQTLTAMFGVLMVLAPLAVPVWSAIMAQSKAYETTQVPPSAALSLLALFLVVWRFIVFVRIVRGAFEWATFQAVLLVLAQEFAMLLTLLLLSGAMAQST